MCEEIESILEFVLLSVSSDHGIPEINTSVRSFIEQLTGGMKIMINGI